jgi:tetratricopeptide (TPR) repeat protein
MRRLAPEGTLYENALKLILSLARHAPSPVLPPELGRLFAQLAEPERKDAKAVEDAIWALWLEHDDPEAGELMERALAAMAQRQFDIAETHLTKLVGSFPRFAEGWNKRATLFFMLDRDSESVADIERALALEPRHFGAICGFAQICLRAGDRAAALAAFETALAINPHMASVQQAVAELRDGFSRRVH